MGTNLRLDRSLIAGVALFEGLAPEELDEVAGLAHSRRFPKGEALFVEGAPALALFVVLDGRVKLTQQGAEGQTVMLGVLGAGDFAGCSALCGAGRKRTYPAGAEAVLDTVALVWDGAAVARLLDRHPRIALNALAGVGERLDATRAQLREVSTERIERRVAHALLRLARRCGRRVEGGVEIDFPIGRQDIAAAIGATLYSVSRVLSAWEQDGVIDGGRQRIVIRNPHRLVAIAEDLPQAGAFGAAAADAAFRPAPARRAAAG